MKNFNYKLLPLVVVFSIIRCNNIQAQDLNTATFFTRSEQYDKAKEVFEQLIKKEPNNSKNYFFYGENYLLDYFADTISNSQTVFFKSAKELYEKGINANPNAPLNYIGLAKIAFYLDDNKSADELLAKAKSFLLPYKKISKMKPPAKEYAFALVKIAESYIKGNNVDTSIALPLVREAIKIDSKNRDIFLITGDIYMLIKDGSNAVKYYNRAQYCDPQSPTAKMKTGNLYFKAKNLMAAIPYFEEAIKLNANYAPAYRELGQLYSMAGRYNESKENFKKYLELTQGNIPAKIRYVTALFYGKEYDEVIKNVEEILVLDKSRVYMNRIAGYSCYEKNPPDYIKALAYMDTLFKNISSDQIINKDYYYMAKILLGKNQNFQDLMKEYDNNKALLEKANKEYSNASSSAKVKLKPNIDSLSLKAEKLNKEISIANKEIDEAFSQFDKYLSFKPKDINLINEIASNYYRFSRFDMAAKTWSKLFDLGRNDINIYMQVGKSYYVGGKYKEADSIFNVAISKFPDSLEPYIYSARTNVKMDPDLKLGLANAKFKNVIEKAKYDSVKNSDYIIEACNYLGYYYLFNENYNTSREYYNRMINLDEKNSDNKVKGYNGLGAIELKIVGKENGIDSKLSALNKAESCFKQIIGIDPKNTSAKNSLKYVQDYVTQIKKGINPNELKGIVKCKTGQPIQFVSIRVKDTAAETYTNAKGEFKFEIPMGSESLIILADGYNQKEIPINWPLKPQTIILEPK